MSRAFVKESAESAPPPERMVSDGPNPVTRAGLAQIEAHVARIEAALGAQTNILLRETLERDLRYWRIKQASAVLHTAPPDGSVGFGARVTFLRRTTKGDRTQSYRIVERTKPIPPTACSMSRAPWRSHCWARASATQSRAPRATSKSSASSPEARASPPHGTNARPRGYRSAPLSKDAPMSAFVLYIIGFIVLLGGLVYGALLLHVPTTWIGVGALVLVGLGVMSAVSHTKRRDPPSEAPTP